MRLLVFGDSIAQGFWDVEGGWVNRIRKTYDQKAVETDSYDQPTIFNLGVSGDSSRDILNRFENETKARFWKDEEFALIFATGVNDSRIRLGKEFSDIQTYKVNLNSILEIARRYSDKIIFVGLTPCVESKTNPVAWGDTCYQNSRIQEFDRVLEDFCKEKDVMYISIFEQFASKQSEIELLPDGVHPNGEGHQFIADVVRPILKESIGS